MFTKLQCHSVDDKGNKKNAEKHQWPSKWCEANGMQKEMSNGQYDTNRRTILTRFCECNVLTYNLFRRWVPLRPIRRLKQFIQWFYIHFVTQRLFTISLGYSWTAFQNDSANKMKWNSLYVFLRTLYLCLTPVLTVYLFVFSLYFFLPKGTAKLSGFELSSWMQCVCICDTDLFSFRLLALVHCTLSLVVVVAAVFLFVLLRLFSNHLFYTLVSLFIVCSQIRPSRSFRSIPVFIEINTKIYYTHDIWPFVSALNSILLAFFLLF